MSRLLLTIGLGGMLAISLAGHAHAPAPAQGGSPPTEPTIQQLRERLVDIADRARQNQLTGVEEAATVISEAIEVLQLQYEREILPGLTSVENDCFFAEGPLARAVTWASEVQRTGAAEPLGALELQAATVQSLMVAILKNCHDEIYHRCILDDADPSVSGLAMLTRQLGFLDGDPIYEQRWSDCEYGWHGSITVKERMEGSSSQRSSQGGADLVFSSRTDGDRTLTIELPNKKEQAKGNAAGKTNGVMRNDTMVSGCTVSIENVSNTVSSGAGEATLRKVSIAQGSLSITFSGPRETGSATAGTSTSVRGTDCNASPPAIPSLENPLSGEPWRGDISDTLADPYALSISDSRTLTFQVNAAGTPVRARQGAQGDTVRIPAVPGLATAVEGYPVLPWPTGPPSNQEDGPTITMTITWNLQFGRP